MVVKKISLFLALSVCSLYTSAQESSRANAQNTFVNPVYAGQDPWVIKGPDKKYYLCSSNYGGIYISRSGSLTDKGIVTRVWGPPSDYEAIWAPELHYINGHWYIYTCWHKKGYHYHNIIVLRADTDDPQGSYTYQGELTKESDFAHAIDATVFTRPDGSMYMLWAGVKRGEKWRPSIWIAPMDGPEKLDLSRMVCIARPKYKWELDMGTNPIHPDCNEAPQALQREGNVFVVYSAARTGNASYCLGLLTNIDGDMLNPDSWKKRLQPVLKTSGNILGPGHCSFTKSPDDKEDWIIYHSLNKMNTWDRSISIKKFAWASDGSPNFGQPSQWGVSAELPSGEKPNHKGIDCNDDFSGNNDLWQEYYYLNGRSVRIIKGQYVLNSTIATGYGEKCLIRGYDYTDFMAEVDLKIEKGLGQAGFIFRSTENAVGENRFKGYFAGIDSTGHVSIGRSDGVRYHVLAQNRNTLYAGRNCHLKLIASGDKIQIFLNDIKKPLIVVRDKTFSTGELGLRSVGSQAFFDNFKVNRM